MQIARSTRSRGTWVLGGPDGVTHMGDGMDIRTLILASCATGAVLLALIATVLAVATGAADGAGLQLGTLLAAGLLLGTGFVAALVTAAERRDTR